MHYGRSFHILFRNEVCKIEVKTLSLQSDKTDGLVAQLNRAFDYGSKGFRFES